MIIDVLPETKYTLIGSPPCPKCEYGIFEHGELHSHDGSMISDGRCYRCSYIFTITWRPQNILAAGESENESTRLQKFLYADAALGVWIMKVWVIYRNEDYEYSHPFAVFSTKELAEKWVRDFGSKISSQGIQELELDYSPANWHEIEMDEEEYFGF